MDEGTWNALMRAAMGARTRAYAPYSGFTVGAAIQAKSGALYVGCNVENASYGATMCAERAAMAAAVAAGERELIALAISTGATTPTPPCGICRQCLVELAPKLPIRSYTGDAYAEYDLGSLLPHAFGRGQLD
ncbi:MAG: cytidine deaminase [Polyangiales bacterium]